MVLLMGKDETVTRRKYRYIYKEISEDNTKCKKVITEEEKVMKYHEGLLLMYYANATVRNSANLTEAIRNAKNSERGVLQQLFSNQDYGQTNKIYQELQKKDVKPEEIDDLTKMM